MVKNKQQYSQGDIKKFQLENFTVFEKPDIEFEKGINVFVGENGMGLKPVLRTSGQSYSFERKRDGVSFFLTISAAAEEPMEPCPSIRL